MSTVVVLRATQKVLRSLPQSEGELGASHNALGDWYVNRLVIDRRPLLLIVSSKSLLAIVAPARDVKTLPSRLARIVGERLKRLPVSEAVVASEVEATGHVGVGKTIDSVFGKVDLTRGGSGSRCGCIAANGSSIRGVEDRVWKSRS